MPKPNLFIVGAPKCGTTALHLYLRQVPEIYAPEEKEMKFFGKDVHPSRGRLQDYLDQYAAADQHQYRLDASPYYLTSKVACQEIYDFHPTSKIIVSVRNPVDRMVSHHRTRLKYGDDIPVDFADALRQQDRLAEQGLASTRETLTSYRECSNYCEPIKRYVDAFGQENVYVMIFDDFYADPQKETRRILEFLDLDATYQFQDVEKQRPSDCRSKTLMQWTVNRPALLKYLGKPIPGKYKIRITNWLKRVNQGHAPRTIAPPLRQQLLADCHPGVSHLSEYLNVDLSAWQK